MTEARQIILEDAKKTIADKSYVGALIRKWKEFLEGMPDRTDRERYVLGTTAILMENQAQHLQALSEDTRTLNVGNFTKFIFPILRRVFPNLIANEIVSVQPMTAPVGAVFYLDYVYGTNKGGTSQGNIFPRDFDRDYSGEYVNGEALATGDGVNYGGGGTALGGTLVFVPVRPLDTIRNFSVKIVDVNPSTGAIAQTATDNGASPTGTFTGDCTAGTIVYASGTIAGFKFTAPPAMGHQIKALYYYDSEMNTRVPQINLDVKQAPVQPISRKIKALWSAEAAEDLKQLHGVDAETEMVAAVAQEIALEIDRDVINQLYLSSGGTTATFDRVPPAGISELDHMRGLITQISTVSNLIHKKTLRAPANWIVTSPEVSALLTQLQTHGDYRPLWVGDGQSPYGPAEMPRPLVQHGQFGVYKTGTLSNKWLVYEDPFFPRDKMLIGLKGGSFLDSGFAWAPYIPLQVTPTFMDPADFSFRKGLRTRYATKLLRSEFYGQLSLLNM